MKRFAIAASALSLVAAAALAGELHKHPNLLSAHDEIKKAMEHVTKAQTANEFDMGGHAQKAKELLEQAEHEISIAAEVASK